MKKDGFGTVCMKETECKGTVHMFIWQNVEWGYCNSSGQTKVEHWMTMRRGCTWLGLIYCCINWQSSSTKSRLGGVTVRVTKMPTSPLAAE